jgi:hypothetical protein
MAITDARANAVFAPKLRFGDFRVMLLPTEYALHTGRLRRGGAAAVSGVVLRVDKVSKRCPTFRAWLRDRPARCLVGAPYDIKWDDGVVRLAALRDADAVASFVESHGDLSKPHTCTQFAKLRGAQEVYVARTPSDPCRTFSQPADDWNSPRTARPPGTFVWRVGYDGTTGGIYIRPPPPQVPQRQTDIQALSAIYGRRRSKPPRTPKTAAAASAASRKRPSARPP